MTLHTTTCPHCDSQLQTDQQRGEVVCSECDTVITEDTIDHGPDWRAFNAEERQTKRRVGAPTTQLLHDKGLSTVISWQNKDASGKVLSARKRQQLRRLRTWDERCRTRNTREYNLKQALGEINRMASALGLPRSTRETASMIYRQALDEELVIGRSVEGVATSALYAAARQHGLPRTLDEIAAVARVTRHRIARTYRTIATALGLAVEVADPRDYLPRFAFELDCSENVRRQAHVLLSTVVGTPYLSGKNPVGLAAAALYASARLADEQLSQDAICDVAGVSNETIRNHYPELIDRHDEDT